MYVKRSSYKLDCKQSLIFLFNLLLPAEQMQSLFIDVVFAKALTWLSMDDNTKDFKRKGDLQAVLTC